MSFISAIMKLYRNSDLRCMMGKNNQERAKIYSINHVLPIVIEHYQI